MSEFIVFENDGEIDPRLIMTFGVNVKENDNAIGFFGTGLKYAISILVRTGHEVTIQSGNSIYAFGLQRDTIRGKDFEFVTMNGAPMGFTTEVGKQWELWMAYRELFCNCQDEGGHVYETTEAPQPTAGKTRAIVSGAEFLRCRQQHDRYFITGGPIYAGQTCRIHEGPGHGIYYRGVLVGCSGSGSPLLYTYDFVEKVTLSEDRTIKNGMDIDRAIARAVLTCEDREIIRRAVTAPKGVHEHKADFDWPSIAPSTAFLEVVDGLLRTDFAMVNSSARHVWERCASQDSEPAPYEPDDFERTMLDRASAFCVQFGFDVTDYPVIPVHGMGPGVLGMAKGERIYVARENFNLGTKQVACTLIEEFIHLRHRAPDYSREMQELLLNRLVTMGERLAGEPL